MGIVLWENEGCQSQRVARWMDGKGEGKEWEMASTMDWTVTGDGGMGVEAGKVL